jgi:hypothetical protein
MKKETSGLLEKKASPPQTFFERVRKKKGLTNYTDARHSIGTIGSHSHLFDDLMYNIRSYRYPETGAMHTSI